MSRAPAKPEVPPLSEASASIDVLGALEESNKVWIDEHCVCDTCANGIDRDLFGNVFCNQKDSIAYGWNPGTSCCEAHHFRDDEMEKTLQKKMDSWYEAYIRVYPDDPPNA